MYATSSDFNLLCKSTGTALKQLSSINSKVIHFQLKSNKVHAFNFTNLPRKAVKLIVLNTLQ